MIIFKTKPKPIQKEQAAVWVCRKEECAAWVRQGLSFEVTPKCPICDSEMILTTKEVPVLNCNLKNKSLNDGSV